MKSEKQFSLCLKLWKIKTFNEKRYHEDKEIYMEFYRDDDTQVKVYFSKRGKRPQFYADSQERELFLQDILKNCGDIYYCKIMTLRSVREYQQTLEEG